MTPDNTANPPSATSGPPRNVLLVLLLICIVAGGAVVYLVMRPADREQETIISMVEVRTPEEAGVNVLHVIDTLLNPDAQAVEGQRYKVRVADDAREGASGIARIGGLVTFVPGTEKGDVVIIEVTRMRRSTADSVVIERLESGTAVPPRPQQARPPREAPPVRPAAPEQPVSPLMGQIHRGTVMDTGREGDGVVRVDGKVVFVVGAELGEHVEFRIIEDMGRFAKAEVVSKSPVPFDEPPAPTPAAEQQARSGPVSVGAEYDVTVTEQDRRSPGTDGVARIDGFVVFVPGTQPGDQVRIRITSVRARAADSEVITE